MDGNEIFKLMAQRHETLTQLMRMTHEQRAAVDSGRMNELMHLLAEKQKPLESLNLVSKQLHQAIDDDPEAREWSSETMRAECRRQHAECEQMLSDLLEMERLCEQQLQQSRSRLEQQILASDGTKKANQVYNQTKSTPSLGGQLDLSSG